jgi:cell shape-determining protein MreD
MIPLGLVSLLIVRARLVIFREHMLAQGVMTFLALALFAVLATVFRRLIGAPLEGQSAWIHFGHLFVNAIYSAVAAPFLFWIFFRFPSMLGFSMQRHWGRR